MVFYLHTRQSFLCTKMKNNTFLAAEDILTHIYWLNKEFVTHLCFPDSSVGKESACDVGDLGLIPGLGRFPGEGKGYPLQYSGLENSMDYRVHGIAKSQNTFNKY